MTSIRSCPVCGQQSAKFLFLPTTSPGPVSKCSNCKMVYIANVKDDHALIFDGPVTFDQADPKILSSSNLDDVKDSWEFALLPDKEIELPALRQNAYDALQRIESHIRNSATGRKILDFGSGWGFFLAAAKEHGWIPYGLEPLPASAVYARAKFGLDVTTDTLRNNTFPPDFFDVVVSFQVFEHLPYPDRDIQNLYTILRQDGIILIEVPNYETWTMQIMKSRHRHFVQDHLNFFSGRTLSKLLTDNGFIVVDRYHSARRMSIRHLLKRWFPQYLPKYIVDLFQKVLQKAGLWEKTISLNIGDIITVIARKA